MAKGPVRECARLAPSLFVCCSKYNTERYDCVSAPAEGKDASCTCDASSTTATELLVVPKSNPTAMCRSTAVAINTIISHSRNGPAQPKSAKYQNPHSGRMGGATLPCRFWGLLVDRR